MYIFEQNRNDQSTSLIHIQQDNLAWANPISIVKTAVTINSVPLPPVHDTAMNKYKLPTGEAVYSLEWLSDCNKEILNERCNLGCYLFISQLWVSKVFGPLWENVTHVKRLVQYTEKQLATDWTFHCNAQLHKSTFSIIADTQKERYLSKTVKIASINL